MKFPQNEWLEVIKTNPRVFLFKYTQIKNIQKFLFKYNICNNELFKIIKEYPDLLIANRYDMLRRKLALFEDLKINSVTIGNLIKAYPFVLLKSYNSFINKVYYFHKELKMDIEKIDIYPLIYVYNLERDIKPRCGLMKEYNVWVKFSEAFSMSVDELEVRLREIGDVDKDKDNNNNNNRNDVDKDNNRNDVDRDREEKAVPKAVANERDLLFRYNKYHTI